MAMMPRVLIYLNDLSGGGAEKQCLTLARELVQEGVGVEIILHQLRGELTHTTPPGVRVINMDQRRTRNDALPLARHIRLTRPDILLANVDHMNIIATLAGALSFTRTKVVITQHNALQGKAETDGFQYRLVAPLYRMLAPFISAAVAVSDGIAEELVQSCGIPKRKVVRIYNAVTGPDFYARAGRPVEHPWFDDERRPVFVTAARLHPQKDQATLLRAMALHVRAGGRGRLLILGVGPSRAMLENLAADLGILNAVDFVGFQSNPLPWFRRADLFVLSSRTEGFGIALAEALGCGTPAVSTDIPCGPAEILGNGRYGVLVPPQNPSALAGALNDIDGIRLRYPPDLLKARAAEFSNAACTSSYLALFRRLAGAVPMGAALERGA